MLQINILKEQESRILFLQFSLIKELISLIFNTLGIFDEKERWYNDFKTADARPFQIHDNYSLEIGTVLKFRRINASDFLIESFLNQHRLVEVNPGIWRSAEAIPMGNNF